VCVCVPVSFCCCARRQQRVCAHTNVPLYLVCNRTCKVIGKEHTESEVSEADGSVVSGDDESELEYPSDEGDESPLDMDMHGDEGVCVCEHACACACVRVRAS
jgi:hypothetical protein